MSGGKLARHLHGRDVKFLDHVRDVQVDCAFKNYKIRDFKSKSKRNTNFLL